MGTICLFQTSSTDRKNKPTNFLIQEEQIKQSKERKSPERAAHVIQFAIDYIVRHNG